MSQVARVLARRSVHRKLQVASHKLQARRQSDIAQSKLATWCMGVVHSRAPCGCSRIRRLRHSMIAPTSGIIPIRASHCRATIRIHNHVGYNASVGIQRPSGYAVNH